MLGTGAECTSDHQTAEEEGHKETGEVDSQPNERACDIGRTERVEVNEGNDGQRPEQAQAEADANGPAAA